MNRFITEYQAVRSFDRLGYPKHHRPAIVRAIGQMIHPKAVTTRWYARLGEAGATTLGRRDRMQWRLSLALRGVAHPGA
jgi:hypothetical protein